jgi:hypothetical protein
MMVATPWKCRYTHWEPAFSYAAVQLTKVINIRSSERDTPQFSG